MNVVHSLALAPALAPALTITRDNIYVRYVVYIISAITLTFSLNHLANKPLPMPSILNVFNQHAVVRKYLIRCATDYK